MGGKGTELRRQTRREDGKAMRRLWGQVYRERIRNGLEHCRNCGSAEDPTFGHIVPASAGVSLSMANATILCASCNAEQGVEFWPHLTSLASEEHDAPPERRWVEIERAERLRKYMELVHAEALEEDRARRAT